MPKFRANVSFDLSTEVEPEMYSSQMEPDIETLEDFDDNSSWGREEVTSRGGDMSFTVEAEDVYAAESLVNEAIFDGQEVEDNNGWTWTRENVRVEVEEIEPEMNMERAKEIVRTWLESTGSLQLPEEVRDALIYLLNQLPTS